MFKKENKRYFRTIQFILIDVIIILFAFWFALKYVKDTDLFSIDRWWLWMLIIIAAKICFLYVFNLYSLLLEFVGFSEVTRFLGALLSSNVLLYVIFMFIGPDNFISLNLLVITAMTEFVLGMGFRTSKRFLIKLGFFNGQVKGKIHNTIPTLVIGAGSGGKLVFDEINKNPNLQNRVIAFVDDDTEKIYQRLNGVPIFGPIKNIEDYIEKYNIKEVIIAIANIKQERLREIIEWITSSSVKIRRLPLMTEITDQHEPKIVDVKIEDLLSRDIVCLDNEGISDFLKDRIVLVTGAGGSIGSELCTQILSYNPRTLILFDIYENTTYDVQLDLRKRIDLEQKNTHLITLIGSVYNISRIEEVFRMYKPEIVFHAAAYKHVPLMEDSAVEAVRTNVLGTYNVAKLANKYYVHKMVLVSTDKAVRPTNVMGATKSCCEKIIQYFDHVSDTSYSAVRFGNVLGSHGSVVPLFKKQIAEGGPVTITDKKITRYFMTIPEAVGLILQSAVYATGGEIFILDMGEPVKIIDMAEKMIRLSGFIPHIDIKIVEVGLRPGEKLYEELLVDKENNIKTENEKIFIERNGKPIEDIEMFIQTINDQFEVISNQEVKKLVQQLATTYIIDDKTNN